MYIKLFYNWYALSMYSPLTSLPVRHNYFYSFYLIFSIFCESYGSPVISKTASSRGELIKEEGSQTSFFSTLGQILGGKRWISCSLIGGVNLHTPMFINFFNPINDLHQAYWFKYNYNNMAFRRIELPKQLIKQHDFGPKILLLNQKVFSHVEYLKHLIEKSHKIYAHLSKEIIKITENYEEKISTTQGPSSESVRRFLMGLRSIYTLFDQQINKNSIYISTKKNDNLKNISEAIGQKIRKVVQNVKEYEKSINSYNEMGEKYYRKADYFYEIEKDAIKFYSMKKNGEKFQKLKKLQFSLEGELQKLQQLKSEIKTDFIQISIKIKYYFDNVKTKVEELKKITAMLRIKINSLQKIRAFDKIQEVSEEAQYSAFSSAHFSPRNAFEEGKKKSLSKKTVNELDIKIEKKQISKEFNQHTFIETTFAQFLSEYLTVISKALDQTKSIQKEKDYKEFCDEKMVMIEFLSNETIYNIDNIVSQLNLLQHIMEKILLTATPTIYEELTKYRKHIFKRYCEEVQNLMSQSSYQVIQLSEKYQELEKKYQETNRESKFRFGEKVQYLLKSIKDIFNNSIKIEKGPPVNQDIFVKTYYEILKLPYFMNHEKVANFYKDKNVLKYEKIQNENKFQEAQFQLMTEMQHQKKPVKTTTSCCGLFRSKEESIPKKKKKKIDSYSCALKDGFMLFQGKIQLYDQYVRFISSFNPHKFFSDTDLCIPKWDICEIIKGKNLMSLLVVIVTKHGNIQFTSFFSDPVDILLDLYCLKTGMEEMVNNYEDQQLENLEKILEDEFISQAKEAKIYIDKFSKQKTDKNTLVVRYQYHETKRMEIYAFQVTIRQFQNALEYTFFHSEGQKKVETKNVLETLTQNAIHRDRKKKIQQSFFQNHLKIGSKKQSEFSFDLKNVSLIKNHQPSFMDQSMIKDLQVFGRGSSSKIMINDKSSMEKINEPMRMSDNMRRSENMRMSEKRVMMQPVLEFENKEDTLVKQNVQSESDMMQRQISSSASTVKYRNKRKQKKMMEEQEKKKEIDEKRKQGLKTFLILIGIAFALYFLLRLN